MASGLGKSCNAAEIDRLALALAKEPGSKAFIPLAEEYGKAGMWQEAAGVLEDGLRSYPNFITAMVALGRAYDQLKQPVKAKAILEEAVKLSPENLRAHRTLAKIYAAQGLKEAALRSCQVILSVSPHDQEALSLRNSLGTPHASETVATKSPSLDTEPLLAPVIVPSMAVPDSSVLQVSAVTEAPGTGLSAPARGNPAAPAIVAKLEQWLSAIQARRRHREYPPRPETTA